MGEELVTIQMQLSVPVTQETMDRLVDEFIDNSMVPGVRWRTVTLEPTWPDA